MTKSYSRRSFLQSAVAGIGYLPFARGVRSWRAPVVLRVGLLDTHSPTTTDRRYGATLGVEEATQAAALFGGSIELVPFADPSTIPAGVNVVLGDDDAEHCRALARTSVAERAIVMNVACSTDQLRGADCSRTLFHVAPSDAMLRAASALAGGGEAVAWDPKLSKFGADTLNTRFSRRFDAPMTPAAWSSWFAVKAVWEAALRLKNAHATQLGAFLGSESAQFDGHKGRPLSFRVWDHQLRQPVYVRTSKGLIEEPTDPSGAAASRDVLDRLGATATTTACHMK